MDEVIQPRPDTVPPGALQAYSEGMKKLPYVLNSLGFQSLRPGQDKAVMSVMMGRDSVVILPTSTGKSACFVVPTLCMGWKTIVIYPLIALMRDQAIGMQKNGLAAATISSNETDAHNASVLRDWSIGNLQFMLVSPERFANVNWAEVVTQFPPDFVCLDECHTFGDWADTFRPGYKFAGEFIRRTRPKVVAAYSATLSEDCESEVREGLGISGAKLVYHYPRRTNLHPSTMYVDSIRDAFPWVTQECNGPTIIYASTRARVESYAASLAGFTKRPVYYYHGGMKPADKKYQQDKFMADSDAIIVATNAFGMGIDKGNIRHVVHFDIPGTLVAYCQEMGRAGRDGKDSYCTIIPTPEGVRTRRHFIRCGNPTAQDIRDFVKAASGMRSGRDGVINAKRDDIARKAGLDVMTIGAVMAFCLGEGIFVHDNDAAKKMRIKFMPDVPSFTKVEAEMRDAIEELGVDMDRDGWLHLDIRALSEQVNREPATVMSRLLTMHKAGKIEWVRSTSTKPLRLGIDIDAVDPESFARLNAKSASANACLQQVLDYCDTADEDKHAFLESHLNR